MELAPPTSSAILAEATARIGGSDCERLGTGVLSQPANAVTSLAYLLVGLGIVVAARRAHGGAPAGLGRSAPWLAMLYGVAVALEGVGSVLYHGPQPPGARWLHDWAIVAILAMVAITDLSLLWRRSVLSGAVVGTVLAGAGVAMAVDDGLGAAVAAVVVLAAVAGEVLVVARGLRIRGGTGVDGPWGLLVPGLLLVVALAAYALGRTGSPLCDPGSWLQLHGLWHLATAATFAWWARVALFAPGRSRVAEVTAALGG